MHIFQQLLELKVGGIGNGTSIAHEYIKKRSPKLFHNMNDYNINRLEDGIERLEYDISIIILANLYTLENGESITRTSCLHQNMVIFGVTNVLQT